MVQYSSRSWNLPCVLCSIPHGTGAYLEYGAVLSKVLAPTWSTVQYSPMVIMLVRLSSRLSVSSSLLDRFTRV
jgi:hypothetical protein